MPLLIVTIISAGATYMVVRDASSRGMNPDFWGTLVMCTATLAVPIYLFMRRARPT